MQLGQARILQLDVITRLGKGRMGRLSDGRLWPELSKIQTKGLGLQKSLLTMWLFLVFFWPRCFERVSTLPEPSMLYYSELCEL